MGRHYNFTKQILVIDLETTCWENKAVENQESEIIEIGISVIDVAKRERVSSESIIVKPERSTVSPFCTQLTTITQEMVDEGISYAEACKILREKYDSRNANWASWGDFDRKQFKRQEQYTPYPFGDRHLNVKNLFALQHQLEAEVGMPNALKILGWPLHGTHHRGVDDANNIAAILMNCLWGITP